MSPDVTLVARVRNPGTVNSVNDQSTAFRHLGEQLAVTTRALDELGYHLEVHLLVMLHGSPDRMGRALADLEIAAAHVAEGERNRHDAAQAVAVSLGLHANAPLSEIAERAPEPWAGLLEHHRRELERVRRVVDELTDINSRSARMASRRTRDLLAAAAPPDALVTTAFGGVKPLRASSPLMVDRSA